MLVMLVIGLFFLGPILAIVALLRVADLRKSVSQAPRLIARIYDLEQRLDAIERRLASLSSGSYAVSPPAVAPAPGEFRPAETAAVHMQSVPPTAVPISQSSIPLRCRRSAAGR